MIGLDKRPIPPVLATNAVRWTAEYAALLAGDTTVPEAARRRYAHQEVRAELRIETRGKCAYCESRIEHVAFAHIEHILPKATCPELVCTWVNLTLACGRCNTAKGEYYSQDCPLLNPYEDDVNEHLLFAGPLVMHQTVDRGMVTVFRLQLNRAELMARRKEAIEAAQRILDLLRQAPPGPATDALEASLDELIDGAGEFSASTRAYVQAARADQ